MIGIIPAGHRLLIKPDEELEFNRSGQIIIPDEVKGRYHLAQITGTLMAIGPTAWKRDDFGNKNWAEVGDRVMFAKYGGLPIKGMDGKQYRLINDEDLIAKIDSEYKLGETDGN